MIGKSDPKPCPTCYAPMRPGPGGFVCEKHGAPARPDPVIREKNGAPSKLDTATQAKPVRHTPRAFRDATTCADCGTTIWRGSLRCGPCFAASRRGRRDMSKVRYASDLKTYPLPPSPDGRDHGRTSRDSPTTARSRLTPALLARAVAAAEAGRSPGQIAHDLWEEAGYASRDACKGSIYRALRNAGVIGLTRATEAAERPTPREGAGG